VTSSCRPSVPIVAVALACAALAWQESPPPAKPAEPTSPPSQDAPAPASPKPDDGPAKARVEEAYHARLAADRKRCEELIAAGDKFGLVDEFTAASRKLLADFRTTGLKRFINVKRGSITDTSFTEWIDWNVPPSENRPMPAVDVKAKGHPFGVIVDLARQLREHDVDFLVVTFPTRPQLYPELFMDVPSFEGFASISPGTPRFALALIDAGVEFLELAPEFVAERYGKHDDGDGDELFLQYNQHWTPRAAEMTAKLLADRLAQYPWFQHGPAAEGKDFKVSDKKVQVSIVWGGKPDDAHPEWHTVHQVQKLDGRAADTVRPSSPITLLSGSYADYHHQHDCDFVAQLYRYTGWQIDKITQHGGLEQGTREQLAKKSNEELSKKKIVIWMIPDLAFKPGRKWSTIPIFKDE
jgi:hypothetical protein